MNAAYEVIDRVKRRSGFHFYKAYNIVFNVPSQEKMYCEMYSLTSSASLWNSTTVLIYEIIFNHRFSETNHSLCFLLMIQRTSCWIYTRENVRKRALHLLTYYYGFCFLRTSKYARLIKDDIVENTVLFYSSVKNECIRSDLKQG